MNLIRVIPAKGQDVPMHIETIRVNGRPEPFSGGTLIALLESREIASDAKGVAVAINGSVVPRAEWTKTQLRAGDDIEIVRARQGG